MELDMDQLAAELTRKMGDRLGALMAEAVDQKIRDLGLDRVDRRHGLVDAPAEGAPPGPKPLAAFLRGAILHREPADAVVRKALSEGDDGAGGYLVPTEYRAELLKRVPELSELFPHVRVIPVVTDAGEFPRLSSDISMTWGRAENADITETDPAFDQLTYSVHNMSGITYMSREVASDSNPSIVDTIRDLFAEAVAAERDKMIAVGDGSNQPEGIYSAAGLGSVAVGGALTYAKLIEIKYALGRKYQRRARWVLNTTNLQRILGLTDTNGQPLVREALVAGEPPRILGKPFSVQDDLPDTDLFYGDLSGYLWFDRQRMTIESTTTGGDTFKKHQVAIKVIERCDGKVCLAEMFVKGTGITG